MPQTGLTEGQRRFAGRAIAKKGTFWLICWIGVAAAVALLVYYGYSWVHDPDYALGLRAALVVLILLNARQNLRQYRYASVLEKLLRGGQT